MILVNMPQTWPAVKAGTMTADQATLAAWPIKQDIVDEDGRVGDVILGIYKNEVVSAYDITGHDYTSDDRVVFKGTPSTEWDYLIGGRSPLPWVSGQQWPVQHLPTKTMVIGLKI